MNSFMVVALVSACSVWIYFCLYQKFPDVQAVAEKGKTPNPGPTFTFEDEPGELPQFKRTYQSKLRNGITLKITLRTGFGGDRYDMSELDQKDGKWVTFDAKSPADKILDRDILPSVQAACDAVLSADNLFMKSKPSEFTDESGQTWIKKETR